jgi:WD40 repeat protein
VLLGDRYGWCPPPSQVPADLYYRLRSKIKEPYDRELLREWYFLDENAVPAEFRLRPRLRGGLYEHYENWQPVESQLHSMLAKAACSLHLDEEQLLPFTASATEQEIAAGSFGVEDAREHVFCFFRSIQGFPQAFDVKEFLSDSGERIRQEYEKGLPDGKCGQLWRIILDFGDKKTPGEFDQGLAFLLTETPRGSLEEDFLKKLRGWLSDFTARDFLDLDPQSGLPDPRAYDQQNWLKKRLGVHVPGNIRRYQAHWTGRGITTGHIDQLCEDVYNALSGVILEEIENPHGEHSPDVTENLIHSVPALDEEGQAQRRFAGERLRNFVGRTGILGNIQAYIERNIPQILAISGKGGTGKSALLAKAIQQTQNSITQAEIIYRFIGATPESTDGRSLLGSLCREISRRYGVSEAKIPLDYQELVPELGKRFGLAKAERPLILFLDSLDQLSSNHGARSLAWLPDKLPEFVRVVVTTRDEKDILERLQRKGVLLEELAGLSRAEGAQLLTDWLKEAGRKLQEPQVKAVLDKFEDSEGTPLYLKLAFEEARLWPSGDGQPPEELATGISGIIEGNLINRLARESNHGQVLVQQALGYLAASRYGLAEDELVDLLSRDLQVYRWFLEGSYHLPADLITSAVEYRRKQQGTAGKVDGDETSERRAAAEWLKEIRTPPEALVNFLEAVLPSVHGPRLPIVLWSRLSFDLNPYLTEQFSESSALMTFYHRELGDVARKLVHGEGKEHTFHEKLGSYFRFKADPDLNRTWKAGDRRGLSELPYHLTKSEQWEELFHTLADFCFQERKTAEVGVIESLDELGRQIKTYSGTLRLEEDLDLAIAAMPGIADSDCGGENLRVAATFNENKAALAALAGALRLSTHVLVKDPGQIASQLYGRLLDQTSPPLQAFRDRIREREGPWLRPLKSSLVSVSSSLLRIVPANWVERVAISPDAHWGVTSNIDSIIEVWDLQRARKIYELQIDTLQDEDQMALSFDGRYLLVSHEREETLTGWDLKAEKRLYPVEGVVGGISYQIDPETREIALRWPQPKKMPGPNYVLFEGSRDGGEIIKIEFGKLGDYSRAETPDGKFALLKIFESMLGLVDLEKFAEARLLPDHESEVWNLVISPDSSRAASVDMAGVVKVWDAAEACELFTINNGSGLLAFSPDGRRLVSIGDHLRVWDLDDRSLEIETKVDTSVIDRVVVSPDGRRAIAATRTGAVHAWDLDSGEELPQILGFKGVLQAMTINPDGKVAVVGLRNNSVRVWDVEMEIERFEFQDTFGADFVALTPDARRAIAGSRHALKAWDLLDGKEVFSVEDPRMFLSGLAISTDGMQAVSVSSNRVLHLWNLDNAGKAASFEGENPLTSCAISPDGHIIIAGEESGVVHFLRLEGKVDLPVPPTYIETRLHKVHLLLTSGRFQEALDLINDSLGLPTLTQDQLARFRYFKGMIHFQLSDLESAVACFGLALEFNPDDYGIWFNQGVAYFKLQRFREALKSFQEARRINNLEEVSIQIAQCYIQLEEYESAVEEYSALVNKGSKEPRVYYMLGVTQSFIGEDKACRENLEYFIKIAGPELFNLVRNAKGVLANI